MGKINCIYLDIIVRIVPIAPVPAQFMIVTEDSKESIRRRRSDSSQSRPRALFSFSVWKLIHLPSNELNSTSLHLSETNTNIFETNADDLDTIQLHQGLTRKEENKI